MSTASSATTKLRFRQMQLSHLDEAYGLACWLVEDRTVAADVVFEACQAAIAWTSSYVISRASVLALVRNGARDWLQRKSPVAVDGAMDAEPAACAGEERMELAAAIADLPAPLREVIVLRDILGVPYSEIAVVIGAPGHVVMQRLVQARGRLLTKVATEQIEPAAAQTAFPVGRA